MPKDKLISFKIEPEAKELFEKLCQDEFKTVSQDLYVYVHQRIKQSNGKRILLTDYKKKQS